MNKMISFSVQDTIVDISNENYEFFFHYCILVGKSTVSAGEII